VTNPDFRKSFAFIFLILVICVGCSSQGEMVPESTTASTPGSAVSQQDQIPTSDLSTPTPLSIIESLLSATPELGPGTSADRTAAAAVIPLQEGMPLPYRCDWPPTQIPGVKANVMYWLPNGDELVYENNGEWSVYSVRNETSIIFDPGDDPKQTPGAVGILNYSDLFASPDGKTFVYTQMIEGGYRVYSSNANQAEGRLLGEIKGMVNQAMWINEGNKLLLSIDWQSPLGAPEAYVYLVDLVAQDLSVVIPATLELANIELIGVTPDETDILFTDYSTKKRILRLWNLIDRSWRDTDLRPPFVLSWFPNAAAFLGVGWVDDQPGLAVYFYAIENQQFVNLTPARIEPMRRSGAIQISPLMNTIAYLDPDGLINLIDCSDLAQLLNQTSSQILESIDGRALTQTPGPKSTLSFEAVRSTAESLLETNGGCKFPCWLGIVPGKTSWKEANELFADIAEIDGGYVKFRLSNHPAFTTIEGRIRPANGLVEWIIVSIPHSDYPVRKILLDYEQPEDVRLLVDGNVDGLGDEGYVNLVLFYPSQGIMVEIPVRTNKGKSVKVCLDEPFTQTYNDERDHTGWFLWDPHQQRPFEQAGEVLDLPTTLERTTWKPIEDDYQAIEMLTGLDEKSFYEYFVSEREEIKCFDALDPRWIENP
jgi:hypothetical protein